MICFNCRQLKFKINTVEYKNFYIYTFYENSISKNTVFYKISRKNYENYKLVISISSSVNNQHYCNKTNIIILSQTKINNTVLFVTN